MSDDRRDLPPVNSPIFLDRVREVLSTYLGKRGDDADRGVTLRDLQDAGADMGLDSRGRLAVRKLGTGAQGPIGPIGPPGPGGGGDYTPDLTPPPTPTGGSVVGTFSNIIFTHGLTTYPAGHGHDRTRVYGATWTTGPKPTFATATKLTEFTGTVFSYPAVIGTQWHIWFTWVTADGVESLVPAGGTNGFVAAAGRIGNSDLGPLIIEAANLAVGAVDGPALKAKSIAVGSAAIEDGAIRNALIANLAVDNAKIKDLNVEKLIAGSLAVGQYIQSTNFVSGTSGWKITADGTAEFAAASIRGQLVASQIKAWGLNILSADGTKTILNAGAAFPIDNSVINPAAGWLNSNVGLPRGQALNANPECSLPSEWLNGAFVTGVAGVPGGTAVGSSNDGQYAGVMSARITPLSANRRYKVSAKAYGSAAAGSMYLGVFFHTASGIGMYSLPVVGGDWSGGTYCYFGLIGHTPNTTPTDYSAQFGFGTAFPLPAGAAGAKLVALCNYDPSVNGGSSVRHYVTDFKVEDITDVSTAKKAADDANASIANISADSILHRSEKPELIKQWERLEGEYTRLRLQATAMGISPTGIDSTRGEVAAFLTAVRNIGGGGDAASWQDLNTDCEWSGSEIRARFLAYTNAIEALRSAIASKAATTADWASVGGIDKPLNNAGKVIDAGDGYGNGQRQSNDPPNWSGYPVGKTYQFKQSTFVGLAAPISTYCTLETIIQFGTPTDGSGGYCTQYAYAAEKVFRRIALRNASAWGDWVQDLDRNAYTGDLNATHGATWGANLFNTPTNLAALSGTESINNSLLAPDIEAAAKTANWATIALKPAFGTFSLLNSITAAEATTRIEAAAIKLAHINTATITNLAALATYTGTLTVDGAGWIRGGQTDWGTGSGFFLGSSGGAYKFSVGNSAAYLRWSPTGGLELKQDTFTVSLNAGGQVFINGTGEKYLFTITATPAGGVSGYTYIWTVTHYSDLSPQAYTAYRSISSSGANKCDLYATSSLGASFANTQYIDVRCDVTDANGRTCSTTVGTTLNWNGGSP